MLYTAKEIIDTCKERNIHIADLVLESEFESTGLTAEEVREELHKMLEVMESSSHATLEGGSETSMGMIDGFAQKMMQYKEKGDTLTGDFIVEAMAMAFSTLEISASMGKIVASPTAGASGILPAALMSAKSKLNVTNEELVTGMLTAVGIGKIIGRYACFSGAEGGCQAECGSAASMSAGALTQMAGGTPEQCLHAASFALIHVLGLVCDPIAGLVEYPCTFRNGSGVVNALISADMALAGVTSIVPFEEVADTMYKVGEVLPFSLRESGIGGVAGTPTGLKLRKEFLTSNQHSSEDNAGYTDDFELCGSKDDF